MGGGGGGGRLLKELVGFAVYSCKTSLFYSILPESERVYRCQFNQRQDEEVRSLLQVETFFSLFRPQLISNCISHDREPKRNRHVREIYIIYRPLFSEVRWS